ncbi:uncharacterized protein IUM83_14497 [Phytophthora cinnamomi]|uniref:uncharacterized protein n=1 Tax=Phytophthora cinnamomi TaxID=4785 RepID=UPI00355AB415|nr:hypothetical protein IUM83_14497 [Phytophthora cinnamomi]
MIFPHIVGDECLVAQLVDQEVEPPIGITFYFNSEGECCKYKLELGFVEAFASIVRDLRKLEMMLGRALIAQNCMLGVIVKRIEKSVDDQVPTVRPTHAASLEYE